VRAGFWQRFTEPDCSTRSIPRRCTALYLPIQLRPTSPSLSPRHTKECKAACVLLGGHRGLADPRPRLRDAIAAVLCLAWAGSAALA